MNFGEFFRYILLLIFFPRSTKTMELRMLRLVNRDRKNHGLKPLRMQEDLRRVARKHSLDMAQKDYFDHVNLKAQSPADRLKIARVTDSVSGENLAKIGGFSHPTQFAEEGLMNSPGHRANILNDAYNVVGIGVIQDSRKIYYFTQNFAKRVLVFKRKIPEKIRIGKTLRITGEAFSEVQALVYQVKFVKAKDPILEEVHRIYNQKFDFKIDFSAPGNYEVLLFIDQEGDGHFILSNTFELQVKKSWLS